LKVLKFKNSSEEIANELLEIMGLYLDAADNYFKDKCFTLANK
jgi:hypothetical protein